MENLESVVKKNLFMSNFVVLYLCIFCIFVIFLDYPYKHHAKSEVIALGTKVKTYYYIVYISSVNYTVQTFLFQVQKFGQYVLEL